MTEVTREYSWPMGHRLQRHRGRCFSVHGHSYVAQVTVGREGRDENGMVMDFGALDAVVRPVIDDWDHSFMVETTDPFAQVLANFACDVFGSVRLTRVPWAPTAENIASELFARLERLLPEGVTLRKVEVWEGPRSSATAGK